MSGDVFRLLKLCDEKRHSLPRTIRNEFRPAGGDVVADRHDPLGLVLGDGLAVEA